MPVRVRCSGCESLYKLPDHLAGKTVRCKSCGSTFKVPAPEVKVDEAAEILAAVESEAEEPGPRHAADEDIFEDSPAKEPRDAEDGDVKAGKKKGRGKKAAGGKRMSMAVLAILVVVVLVVLGGVAGGAYYFLFSGSSKTPPLAKGKVGVQHPKNPIQAKNVTQSNDDKAEEGDPAKEEPIPVEGPISYVKHVKPFLSKYCGKCHGDQKPKAGITLTSMQGIMRGGKGKQPLVVPMEPDQSPLVLAIEHKGKHNMPPPKEKRQPNSAEKAMLRIWVTEGAQDDTGKAGVLLPRAGPQLPPENGALRRVALVGHPMLGDGASLQVAPHPVNSAKAK